MPPIHHGQAQKPDANPDQLAGTPEQCEGDAGDIAVAKGTHEETL